MVTRPVDPDLEAAVRERVQTCLEHGLAWRLGTESTAPNRGEGEVSRSLERLDLVDAVEADGDATRYTFEATVHETVRDTGPPPAEDSSRRVEVAGHIILDEDLDFTLDERGRVRFEPGPVVHPRFWADDAPGDPPLPNARMRNVEAELASDTNPIRWRAERRDDVRTEVATRLAERGEAVVLADPDAEPPSTEEFEAAMEAVSRSVGPDNELELPRGPYREGTAVFRRTGEEST